jgi:hypothetical protein
MMSTSQIASCNALNQPLSGSSSNSVTTGKEVSARQVQQTLRAGVLDALGVKGAHGVRGIAAALRDVLAKADPNAPDPVPSLLETINASLDTAAKKLAAQGVDQSTIDAAIKRFRSDLARELDGLAPGGSADPAAAGSPSAAAIHAVTKDKFSLDILTAEGDRVSIRFRTSNVTDVAAAQTTDGSTTASASDAHVISRGSLKIEVNGDLNDDERKAIGDLLNKVDGIAKDFFGGDVQAAFSAAARVGFDSQEISGFSLKLSYSQRIGFASTYAAASLPVAAAPATPAVPSAQVPVGLDPISLPPATNATRENTNSVQPALSDTAAPVAPASAQQTITSFANSVLTKLAAVPDGGQLQFSLRWKVDFLMTAIAASKPAQDAAPVDSTTVLNGALTSQLAS